MGLCRDMIISQQNKYLFIEIPHTGSTAIKHELCNHYQGVSILKKHSFYSDFLKIAGPEEKNYFVFAGIRNPLDEAVSHYFKFKTNHRGMFTRPDKRTKVGFLQDRRARMMYSDIQNKYLDFQAFFMKYYKVPYTNFASLITGHYDYLLRFERLQEDFARVLRILGLEPIRSLPVRNPTEGRKADFSSYYPPSLIPRAKRVFGPFMRQWGYEFPAEWGEANITWFNQFEFQFFTFLRKVKWKYFRSVYYDPQRRP